MGHDRPLNVGCSSSRAETSPGELLWKDSSAFDTRTRTHTHTHRDWTRHWLFPSTVRGCRAATCNCLNSPSLSSASHAKSSFASMGTLRRREGPSADLDRGREHDDSRVVGRRHMHPYVGTVLNDLASNYREQYKAAVKRDAAVTCAGSDELTVCPRNGVRRVGSMVSHAVTPRSPRDPTRLTRNVRCV